MDINIRRDLSKITNILIKTTAEVLNIAKIKTSPGEAKSKFKVIINDKELTVTIPGYYSFVDKGRKKDSKKPPIKAIMKWIKDSKIKVPKESSIEALAWAISASIGKKGIKPKPFIEELQLQLGVLTRDFIVNTLNKAFKK